MVKLINTFVLTCVLCMSSVYNFFADGKGQQNKYAFIQYLLHGPEVQIKIRPHGNSKANQPIFRTSTSTRKRIGELATRSTPKEVITEMTREKGGELEAT